MRVSPYAYAAAHLSSSRMLSPCAQASPTLVILILHLQSVYVMQRWLQRKYTRIYIIPPEFVNTIYSYLASNRRCDAAVLVIAWGCADKTLCHADCSGHRCRLAANRLDRLPYHGLGCNLFGVQLGGLCADRIGHLWRL